MDFASQSLRFIVNGLRPQPTAPMRMQNPHLYAESQEQRLSNRLLMDLNGARFSRYRLAFDQALRFARIHRIALIISTLSLALGWQWHVASLATQRADMAERDMQMNARQAIQLSEAVLNAQESHDRIERNISGYALPQPK